MSSFRGALGARTVGRWVTDLARFAFAGYRPDGIEDFACATRGSVDELSRFQIPDVNLEQENRRRPRRCLTVAVPPPLVRWLAASEREDRTCFFPMTFDRTAKAGLCST
jgi:hypothetical protein